ncbi:MAG: hypothetical protein JF614_23250 [Acidobacteria bacterium]|nr:hypothetical protein [Acidobacteriota bacterium]
MLLLVAAAVPGCSRPRPRVEISSEGSRWDLVAAKNGFAARTEELSKLQRELQKGIGASVQPLPCTFRAKTRYRCYPEDFQAHGFRIKKLSVDFFPPFPTFYTSNFTEPKDDPGLRISWVPVDRTLEGSELLRRLKDAAESEKPFQCAGTDCRIVEWTYIKGKEKEEHLSICSAAVIREVAGAPYACRPVVLFSKDAAWIEAVTGRWGGGFVFDTPLKTLNAIGVADFGIKIASEVLPSQESILRTLEQSMAAQPLRYVVTRKEDYVLAVDRYKPSPVIAGYREIATIRIDVATFDRPDGPHVKLTVTTTLLLNRQNTGNTADYRGASDAESDVYVEKIRSLLWKAIEKFCIGNRECRNVAP